MTAYQEALVGKGRERIKLRPHTIETMGLMSEVFQQFVSDCAARRLTALHLP